MADTDGDGLWDAFDPLPLDFSNSSQVNGIVWGPAMLILILGTGLYLMVGLGFMPLRRLPAAFRLMFQGRRAGTDEKGEITPFQSLMTALAATIGTGNIAGVATAIALGGPGAVFWMWMTALVGMATKYGEAVLAIRYREVDAEGRYVGGPMYYIKNGLGPRWAWMGWLFAFFAAIAGFGIGNMVQANSLADVFRETAGVPTWATGLVLTTVVFVVIIGGLKRIAAWSDKLVPFMAIVYVAGSLAIIGVNIAHVPDAFALIFRDAFTGTAAAGGQEAYGAAWACVCASRAGAGPWYLSTDLPAAWRATSRRTQAAAPPAAQANPSLPKGRVTSFTPT